MPDIIDLDVPEAWPSDLRGYLEENYDTLLGWESGSPNRVAREYDLAIYGLQDILDRYVLVGWHCTRLTDQEVNHILASGMELPNLEMLKRRIDAIVSAGLIAKNVAQRLKIEKLADDEYRAGRVWFCFFHPRLGDEEGIKDFFRFWGGEALYNSFGRNPASELSTCQVGLPCIVEAVVPIVNLSRNTFLPTKLVRIYLISRGYETREETINEGASRAPLPAENIRKIIRFPSPEFLHLTGCDKWSQPLLA